MKIAVANYPERGASLVKALETWCAENSHELLAEQHADMNDFIVLCRKSQVLIATKGKKLGADFFAEVPNLKMIITWGSGYEQLDLRAAETAGILTANAGAYSNPDVAELAVIHILCASRKIGPHLGLVKDGRWAYKHELNPLYRSKGKVAGLLGFGQIARETSWRLIGVGFRVIAADPYVSADQMAEYGVEKKETEELFRESDFISLHLRVTEETAHIINDSTLALMKPTAYLINVSRGRLVDEEALLRALREKRIAGAGLDVLEEEPPSGDNPLLSMPEVIVTPHCGAGTVESHSAHAEEWFATINDFAQGFRPVRNSIKPLPSEG